MASRERDLALDGLRGIAAAVVVMDHILLVSPAAARVLQGYTAPTGSWVWWVTNTPLFLLFAGNQAVMVFFVISGYVLMRPWPSGMPRSGFLAYLPRRAVRLYLPVAAAVLLAGLLTVPVPRTNIAGASWWLNGHVTRLTVGGMLRDVAAVSGTDWLNTPLWSLQWELIFSALLPVYVLFVVRRESLWWAKVFLLLGLVVVGARTGHRSVEYLPFFALGGLLCAHQERLAGVLTGCSATGRRWLTAVVLILLIDGYLVAQGSFPATDSVLESGCVVGSVLGACGLVAMATTPSPIRTACLNGTARRLGGLSFSLYLVHEPVVVTLAYLLGGHPNLLVLYTVAIPCAGLVAVLFCKFVEQPSSRLAGRHRRCVEGPRALVTAV